MGYERLERSCKSYGITVKDMMMFANVSSVVDLYRMVVSTPGIKYEMSDLLAREAAMCKILTTQERVH